MTNYANRNFYYTKHAEARCSQRGISSEVLQFVLANFDLDHSAGAGMAAVSISKTRIRLLEEQGAPVVVLERAARTVLLIAEDGAIVTAINRLTWHNRRWTGVRRPQPRRLRRRGYRSYTP